MIVGLLAIGIDLNDLIETSFRMDFDSVDSVSVEGSGFSDDMKKLCQKESKRRITRM